MWGPRGTYIALYEPKEGPLGALHAAQDPEQALSPSHQGPSHSPRKNLLATPLGTGLPAYLPAGHAVEEELLRTDARQEAPVHESPCPGAGVVGQKRGQGPPTQHQGHSPPFQLNLA